MKNDIKVLRIIDNKHSVRLKGFYTDEKITEIGIVFQKDIPGQLPFSRGYRIKVPEKFQKDNFEDVWKVLQTTLYLDESILTCYEDWQEHLIRKIKDVVFNEKV